MKVLFLDSWTGGIHNFIPIFNKLKERGVQSLLVHRGSWGDDIGRPLEEFKGGMICRDIKYYKTNLLYRVIARERPSAVVILTTRTFTDRAIIIACKALGVRSYYLMHGAISVGETHEGQFKGQNETLRKQRWSRAIKYIHRVLPNYFYSGTRYRSTFAFRLYPYSIIWKTFANPAEYYWAPPASPELRCDWALAWASAYSEKLQQLPGYTPHQIVVTGPPPLDAAASLLNNPPTKTQIQSFREKHKLSSELAIVLYLETPGVEAGFTGWTRDSRIEHLEELITIVWSSGRQLVIKLHPASDSDSLAKYEEDERVRIIQDIDLPMLVQISECVIGYMSTTLDIAILLGKSIVTPTWGISASLPRDLVDKKLAYPVPTPGDLFRALVDPKELLIDEIARREYIDQFITLTDGKSINRICDAICKPVTI